MTVLFLHCHSSISYVFLHVHHLCLPWAHMSFNPLLLIIIFIVSFIWSILMLIVSKLDFIFSNHSRIPLISSLCSTMKSLSFSSICIPGFNSTPQIINITALTIPKKTVVCYSHYIYIITVHQLALSDREETNSGSVHTYVSYCFIPLPTRLYRITSELHLLRRQLIINVLSKPHKFFTISVLYMHFMYFNN